MNKTIVRSLLVFMLLVLFTAAGPISPSSADSTIVVNTALDVLSVDGKCSLREAIDNTNNDSQFSTDTGECAGGTGNDTILFDGDMTISLTDKIVVNDSSGSTTIDGETNDVTVADSSRTIFQAKSDTTIRNLTIKNGSGNSGFGGGIVVDNRVTGTTTLTLVNVIMTDNTAFVDDDGSGGAISGGDDVILIIRDSLIKNNSAGSSGGAIYVRNGAVIEIYDSTFSGNNADTGGAIKIFDGPLTITRSMINDNTAQNGGAIHAQGPATIIESTVSANTATGDDAGGAIKIIDRPLTLTNSTVSGNRATTGAKGGIVISGGPAVVTNSTIYGNSAATTAGGIFVQNGGSLTLNNSIVANNTGSSGGDCTLINGSTISASYSLIQNSGADACGLTDGVDNNIIGTAKDPLLDALGDNGGPTLTHALQSNSPAIDKIPTNVAAASLSGERAIGATCGGLVPDTDQRGYDRPDTGCDIGAYEFDGTLAISLGWFSAQRQGETVDFRWQTATEFGTAGFNVLAATESGKVKINDDLIPSPAIDSVEPIDYSYSVAAPATVFFLQEVAIDGLVSEHGPFEIGATYGAYAQPDHGEMAPRIWLPMLAR